MVKLKRREKTLRSRFALVVGCTFSLLAIIMPFYHLGSTYSSYNIQLSNASLGLFGGSMHHSTFYWSFMSSETTYISPSRSSINATIKYYGLQDPFYISLFKNIIDAYSYPHIFFAAYWFGTRFEPANFPILLITLFATQLLTFAAGLASLFRRRPILTALAVPLGAVTAMLMFFSCRPGFLSHGNGSFQPGFLFALLAPIAFAIQTSYELNPTRNSTLHLQSHHPAHERTLGQRRCPTCTRKATQKTCLLSIHGFFPCYAHFSHAFRCYMEEQSFNPLNS